MKRSLLLLLPALLVDGGCVIGGHPFRLGFHPQSSGQTVTQKAVDALTPGVTTYAEVVASLGEPWLEFKDQNVIGYVWESRLGSFSTFGKAAEVLHHRNQAFALQFNHQQVLQRDAFFSATNSDALHTSIHNWAESKTP